MIKNLRGLGILKIGDEEFLLLPDSEGGNYYKPLIEDSELRHRTWLAAKKFPIAEGHEEFRNPHWLTLIGNGYIRWFPKESYFDVETVE